MALGEVPLRRGHDRNGRGTALGRVRGPTTGSRNGAFTFRSRRPGAGLPGPPRVRPAIPDRGVAVSARGCERTRAFSAGPWPLARGAGVVTGSGGPGRGVVCPGGSCLSCLVSAEGTCPGHGLWSWLAWMSGVTSSEKETSSTAIAQLSRPRTAEELPLFALKASHGQAGVGEQARRFVLRGHLPGWFECGCDGKRSVGSKP